MTKYGYDDNGIFRNSFKGKKRFLPVKRLKIRSKPLKPPEEMLTRVVQEAMAKAHAAGIATTHGDDLGLYDYYPDGRKEYFSYYIYGNSKESDGVIIIALKDIDLVVSGTTHELALKRLIQELIESSAKTSIPGCGKDARQNTFCLKLLQQVRQADDVAEIFSMLRIWGPDNCQI